MAEQSPTAWGCALASFTGAKNDIFQIMKEAFITLSLQAAREAGKQLSTK